MIVFVARDLSEAAAHALEVETIAKYGRIDNGTGCLRNLTDGGDGTSGWIMPDTVKARLSRIRKGMTLPEKWRRNISSSHKGFIPSEITRAKLREANSGKILSEEHKKKIGAANSISLKGKPQSAESRARKSESLRRCYAENRRVGGRKAGFHHSPETIAKMSGQIRPNRGKPWSDARRAAHIPGRHAWNWKGCMGTLS